jgi:predicted nucleic acid-binding protein
MTFLLDTNVISEIARPAPARGVVEWLSGVDNVALSAICVDEIYFGLTSRPNARLQRALEAYIEAYCTLLDVTAVIAKHAGILRGQLAKRGRVRSQADMLIAATASAHGLTLATRNTRDFDGCGIALYDPFS